MCFYIFALFHANEIRKGYLMPSVELMYTLIYIHTNMNKTGGDCSENFPILLQWEIFLKLHLFKLQIVKPYYYRSYFLLSEVLAWYNFRFIEILQRGFRVPVFHSIHLPLTRVHYILSIDKCIYFIQISPIFPLTAFFTSRI